MHEIISSFEADIARGRNDHKLDIDRIAEAIDAGGDKAEDMSEELDDVVADIKSDLGANVVNQFPENEADDILTAVEQWVTDNISNADTKTRVAAAIALVGRDEFVRRIGIDTKTYTIEIDEIQHHRRIYTVTADSPEEAITKAVKGETYTEYTGKFVGVVSRDNAEIVAIS